MGDELGWCPGDPMTGRRAKMEDVDLLREVLVVRAPARIDELLEKVRSDTLTHGDRAQLCEMIGAEFVATGLDAESEPTERGHRLERLLDAINRPNITDR